MAEPLIEWTLTESHEVLLSRSPYPMMPVAVPATVQGAAEILYGPERPPASALIGSWLSPHAGVVPAEPRPEAATLTQWCVEDAGPLLKVVTGAGGQGKTHLAGQVCARLRERGLPAGLVRLPPAGWNSWSINSPAFGRAWRRAAEVVAGVVALTELSTRALLIVDLPGQVDPAIAELLDVVVQAGAEQFVRVLVLTRTDQGCFRELADRHRLADRVDANPIVLGPLFAGWKTDRLERFRAEAISAFRARHSATALPAEPVPARHFPTTLDLYADALWTALGNTTAADPVMAVLKYERRQILFRLHEAGLDLWEEHLDWALATVTLRPVAGVDEAAAALGLAPELSELEPELLRRLAVRLHDLFPDPHGHAWWQAPEPRRLNDINLLDLAYRASSAASWCADLGRMCGTDDELVARQVVTVLHRCLPAPRIRAGIVALLDRYPGSYAAALTVTDLAGFADEVVARISNAALAEVRELNGLFPALGFPFTYAAASIAASKRCLADTSSHPDPSQDLYDLRGDAEGLATRLSDLGRHAEALHVMRETTAVIVRHAEADPGNRGHNAVLCLATVEALAELSGDRNEYRTAVDDAVTTCRRLIQLHSNIRLSDLARFLLLQADLRWDELNRLEGLAAFEEAVDLYRRLATTKPLESQEALAELLPILATGMCFLGRLQQSLATAQDGVAICRRLVVENRYAYAEDLAAALGALSTVEGELDRLRPG